MRKNTGDKELVRPTIIRFATHFLTLQCLNSQQKYLKTVFLSNESTSSWWAHRKDGNDTKKKDIENSFWQKSAKIVKIGEPHFKLLQIVDGEKLAMGYIYEAMD